MKIDIEHLVALLRESRDAMRDANVGDDGDGSDGATVAVDACRRRQRDPLAEALALLTAAVGEDDRSCAPSAGARYRHKKTGGVYRVIADPALMEADKTPVVVYQSEQDGQVWVRPAAMFHDGRFERIGEAAEDQINSDNGGGDKILGVPLEQIAKR